MSIFGKPFSLKCLSDECPFNINMQIDIFLSFCCISRLRKTFLLSVIMLSVILLTADCHSAECHSIDCHSAESHYAECHSAE
jgi:hypothetical protein